VVGGSVRGGGIGLEGGEDRLEGLLGGGAGDHGDAVFVVGQGLEVGELRGQEGGGHEVPLTAPHALVQGGLVGDQVDEEDAPVRAGQQVPVGALEGGAGDDGPRPAVRLLAHPGAQRLQPRPAVLVGQGRSPAHLGDIDLGVEVVRLGDGPSQGVVEIDRGGGLPASGDPHEHEMVNGLLHDPLLVTSSSHVHLSYRLSGISGEDRGRRPRRPRSSAGGRGRGGVSRRLQLR